MIWKMFFSYTCWWILLKALHNNIFICRYFIEFYLINSHMKWQTVFSRFSLFIFNNRFVEFINFMFKFVVGHSIQLDFFSWWITIREFVDMQSNCDRFDLCTIIWVRILVWFIRMQLVSYPFLNFFRTLELWTLNIWSSLQKKSRWRPTLWPCNNIKI